MQWGNPYPVPGGFGTAAALHADGSVVQLPLAAALRAGLVDVPIIISHVGQELGWDDGTRLTPAQWAASFAANMPGFSASQINAILAAYASDALISPQLALANIAADLQTTCAMPGLAADAIGVPGAARTAPIYLLLGEAWPGVPQTNPDGSNPAYSNFSTHFYDLTAGWGLWSTCCTDSVYVPTAGDLAYGRATRATWYSLMTNAAAAPPGLKRADAVAGWPQHYNMFVQGNASFGGQGAGANIVDFRADKCALWKSILGGTHPWWWVN